MRKRVLSLFLALMMALTLVPAALAAETDKPERGVLTYSEVIKPQYEDAGQFSEDLAAVKQDGKWGYVDHDNNVVIPFQYELAYDFNEGYAVVAKSSHKGTDEWNADDTYYEMGFIDKAGKYTPFMVRELDWETGESTVDVLEVEEQGLDARVGSFFHNGFAYICGNLYRPDGSTLEMENDFGVSCDICGPVNEGLAPIQGTNLGGMGGWVDVSTGKLVYASDGGITTLYSFNQGLSAVYDWNVEGYGFVDRNFNWVLEPQFTAFYYTGVGSIQEFFGDTGLAMVAKQVDGTDKYGAVDKTGAVKIPFQYEELWPISEGLILFMQNGKYGYLDGTSLEAIIPTQYEKATSFHDGMAVVYDGTKAFLIDRKGNPIPGADSLDPKAYFHEDAEGNKSVSLPGEYVVIEKDGKYGFGHIEYLQPLPEKDEMHDWAYEEVVAAIENDLVPGYLQNLYLNDIKRGEFCDVIIQALEAVLDQDIEQIVLDKTGEDITNYQHTYPFVDTTDTSALAANKLGIVNGKGNGRFDPYANITRQEAATMLMRAAKVLDMNSTGTGNTDFSDSEQVASWAAEAVDYICKAGIMNGKGDSFDPTGSYSREQSFMTIYRLFQRVMGQN